MLIVLSDYQFPNNISLDWVCWTNRWQAWQAPWPARLALFRFRDNFFVNSSFPPFEASLLISPQTNYHLPGFGEKAGPGTCRAGKPLWSNDRCLRLQWSLYTSRLQTHPGGANSLFNIEEHTLCPRCWEQGPTLRPRPILERLFVSCQGKPSTLKLTLVLMCPRWRPEMQLKFSIQLLRIEVTYWKNKTHFYRSPLFCSLVATPLLRWQLSGKTTTTHEILMPSTLLLSEV